jgi:hypothetical protein
MAFQPQMTYHRQWVPNYITTSVPVTRMVATQQVRTVTYNVTRYEQFHTVQKIPVNRVVMVPEEITVQRPVTVYRTVPIGTSVAWVPAGSIAGGTATALGPSTDKLGKVIRRDIREAERTGEKRGYEAGKEHEKEKFQREQGGDSFDGAAPRSLDGQRSQMTIPQRTSDNSGPQQFSQRVPSAVSVNGWMARNGMANAAAPQAPVNVSVADSQQ